MRTKIILAAASLGAAAPRAGAAERAPDRPDVLFICIDDLNDWVGFLGGHPQAHTPHMDRLAARGTLFTNAHAPATVCNPSRAAVMSGLRPFVTGVYGIRQPYGEPLREVLTLNRFFMREGYRVFGTGKLYHSGGGLPDEHETCWHGYYLGGKSPSPPVKSMSGLKGGDFDWGPLDVADEEMRDYRRVSWAIDRLMEPHEQPLFIGVGIGLPHLPWYAPRKYFDRFPIESIHLPEVKENDLDDISSYGLSLIRKMDHNAVLAGNQWAHAVQGYLACIAFVDEQIGRLIDALDRSGRADRTVIVLWSDHGWHLGEKQHWRKFVLWEHASRTPFAVVAPGVTTPGTRSAAVVDLMCIYPTLADLAGFPVPAHVQGESLRPLLLNPDVPRNGAALITHWPGNHAVRDAHWRYIRYEDGSEELYDHRNDPREYTNLAGDPRYDEVKIRLAAAMPARDDEAVPAPDTNGNIPSVRRYINE